MNYPFNIDYHNPRDDLVIQYWIVLAPKWLYRIVYKQEIYSDLNL
jgi:hypothetical protein